MIFDSSGTGAILAVVKEDDFKFKLPVVARSSVLNFLSVNILLTSIDLFKEKVAVAILFPKVKLAIGNGVIGKIGKPISVVEVALSS